MEEIASIQLQLAIENDLPKAEVCNVQLQDSNALNDD